MRNVTLKLLCSNREKIANKINRLTIISSSADLVKLIGGWLTTPLFDMW